MKDPFSACHPAVNLFFYIGAMVMGMCFLHPLFLVCSLGCAFSYYRIVKGRLLKYLAEMSVLFLVISAINPLFNVQGAHRLFTYMGGRPYTFEALCYGMALAAMLITVLTWFATWNEVMTSDKFLYCFGKAAPSVSLILTMVFRLVPSFEKKCVQIAGARKCIGKSVENGTTSEKAEHGMVIVSALTSWALEGGVVMADSMKSRGFGCGARTSFSIYRLRKQDIGLLVLLGSLAVVILCCALHGAMSVTYTPVLSVFADRHSWTVPGAAAYVIFLSIPTVLSVMEAIRWHILRSGI